MKIYSSEDWADPENPTREEFSLWLRAEPTRGLRMIEFKQEEFAKEKAGMSPAERRRKSALIQKEADGTARFMLHHLFDLAESIPANPRLFPRDPDATPKTMQLIFSLLALARKYVPHVQMPERAKWRSLIRQVDTVTKDTLGVIKSDITHQPLPPEISRRWQKYVALMKRPSRKDSRRR